MEWKKIRDLPYECNDLGQVRNSRTGRILKPDTIKGGYLRVTFSVDGETHRELINRIVCETFKGPPANPDLVARHLDGDTKNNAPANLAWGTRSENEQDKRSHGTYQALERNPFAKLTEKIVADIRRRYAENKAARTAKGFKQVDHGFVKSLAQELRVSISCVKFVIQNRNWKAST